MPSRSKTVTEYMHEVSDAHLDTLTELREICLQTLLPAFKESMEFGMPSYSRNGEVAVAWASNAKDGLQVQIFHDQILKKYKPQLKHADITKSTIRFKLIDQEDLDILRQMLTEIASEHSSASSGQ